MFDGQTVTADGLPIVANGNGVAHGQPLQGEIVPDEDDTDDAYRVEIVNMRKMTWGDQMIFTRYQLLVETIGDADEETSTKEQRVSALRELLAGFDELTAFFDRVAKVSKNGQRVRMNAVPMDFIGDIMDAISKARARRPASKN